MILWWLNRLKLCVADKALSLNYQNSRLIFDWYQSIQSLLKINCFNHSLLQISSEVSAFMICLVMLDRLLVIQFPLHRQFHFSWKSAFLASFIAWLLGCLLAIIPLLPAFYHWEYYQQNGICLPLPITRQDFPGHVYSLSVFIVLNFTIFMLIGSGQMLIYRAVQQSSKVSKSASSASMKEMAIARRLFMVVFSDFCCWSPVGVMGLLANTGTKYLLIYNLLK